MKRLFQHIIPLKLLVLLLLVNPFHVYPQQIVLERISIEPTDNLHITFEGEFFGIEELYLRFYPNINDPTDHFDYPIDINDGNDQVIFFPEAAAHTGQLHFRLFAEFDNGASRSKIHSAIFLQSIESLSEACEFAVNAKWSNYAIYDDFDNVIQDPPIFDKVQVLMSGFDTSEGRCMIEDEITLAQYAQPLADSERVIELAEDVASGGETYCFRLRSIKSDNPDEEYSYSNIQIVDIPELLSPDRPFITAVDVDNNEGIEIRVDVDDAGFSLFEYILQRSDNPDFGFVEIDRSMHIESHLPFYDDDIPHFDNHPWYYRVVADILDCPMDTPRFSDILSSVFLNADINFNSGSENEVEINLEWDHYFIDGNYDYTLIKQLAGGTPTRFSNLATNSLTDVLQLDELGVEVKYIVEAIRTNSTNSPVYSNYILFSPEWLKPPPNAFRPGSTIEANQKFIPEFYFPEGVTGYSLSIYDRNGLRVFQTPPNAVPGEGWDGIIQSTGQPAPEGAYIYEISFDQADKPTRGVVYLVR